MGKEINKPVGLGVPLGIAMVQDMASKMALNKFKSSEAWTLGDLIKALEEWPDKADACRFGFGGLAPLGFDSYRGYYDHLALGFQTVNTYPDPTVQDVLNWALKADGGVFYGYKGGEFQMDRDTPVWVANSGETSDTVIVGVCPRTTHQMVLLTDHRPLH